MNRFLFQQIFRFGLVGVIAAVVHFTIVVYLVQVQKYVPLFANVCGFIIAFQVSYWGNKRWTFGDSEALHRVAMPKLILVQLVNFTTNETLFCIFLSLNLPYPMALLIVLTILPVFTFASSKWWVFR